MNKFIFLFSRLSFMALFFMVLKFFQIQPGLLVEETELKDESSLKVRRSLKKPPHLLASSMHTNDPKKERNMIQSNFISNPKGLSYKKESFPKKGLSLIVGNKVKERELRKKRRARYIENLAKRRVYEKKYDYKRINDQDYIITNDLVAVKSEGKSNSNIKGYDIKHISKIGSAARYSAVTGGISL